MQMKAYMAYFHKRKNAKIDLKPVTIKIVNNEHYHVEAFSDIHIEQMEVPINENGKVYIYSTSEDTAMRMAENYISHINQ